MRYAGIARLWTGMSLLLVTIFLLSCKTAPRKMAPRDIDYDGDRTADMLGYLEVNQFNPEMFPTERALIDRRAELQINWALRKAQENNQVRVRAIAPPLQITGNDEIDLSRTYQILLVADDVPETNTFMEVYDVRVGPKPLLATVQPARSATNLAEADRIFGEEQLTRLQLDKATVRSSGAFATNYAPVLTNYLAEAGEAHTNQLRNLISLAQGLTNRYQTLTNQIVTLSNRLVELKASATNTPNAGGTNNAPVTLTNTPAANGTNGPAANGTNSPRAAATNSATAAITDSATAAVTNSATIASSNNVAAAVTDSSAANSSTNVIPLVERQLAEAISAKNQVEEELLKNEVSQLQQTQRYGSTAETVAKLMRQPALTGSIVKAIEVLEEFWKDWLSGNRTLSAIALEAYSYRMKSAVMVSFRAESLKQLQMLTIEVLRKIPSPKSQKSERGKGTPESDETAILKKIDEGMIKINKLLLADTKRIDKTSLVNRLKVENDYVAIEAGRLSARLALLGPRRDQSPNKTAEKHLNKEELLADSLVKVKTSTSNLVEQLREDVLKNRLSKNTASQITLVRAAVGEAIELATARTLPIDPETKPPTNTDSGAETSKTALSSLDLIQNGDLAIFRFNILRGVVSTTTFLVADDGAAQLFGTKFSDQFFVAQVTFRNPDNSHPILIYGNTMKLLVRMNALNPDELSEDGESKRLEWWGTYEPLDYDTIRRMLAGAQEHSLQRHLSKLVDAASIGLGVWGAAFDPSRSALRFIAAYAGVAPSLRAALEADLNRNALNFREKGLNHIEEIQPGGTLTKYVFLPKGPIYGEYAHDFPAANELPLSSAEGRWNIFKKTSADFGKRALQPAYIHNLRKDEVYVEGKRILESDPLTSGGSR